jgi:peptide/nickel transport system permease protein
MHEADHIAAGGAIGAASIETPAPIPRAGEFGAFIARRPIFLAGYAIVAAVLIIAMAAPLLAPHSPVDADAGAYLLPPSFAHPMGTDTAGLDIFSRVLHAPRIDLAIALFSTAIAALAGSFLGATFGLWDGRPGIRRVLAALGMRIADIVQAFPMFALALVLVAVLGQGVQSIVLAIAIVNVPVYLRLVRAQTLTIRSQPYFEAARIAGASDFYGMTRHVLPNALPMVLAQCAVGVGSAILLTAGLSFIGAGIRAPTPEWGSMIASGFQNVVTGQWWPSLFPGGALAVTIFGFSAIGASVEAWCNPYERTRPSRRAWRRFAAEHVLSRQEARPLP